MATAKEIVERCGGAKALAGWLDLDRTTVLRWTMPTPQGCGDRIPSKNWAALIATADRHGIRINPEELIPPAVTAAASDRKRRRAA